MKLWKKKAEPDPEIERFTAGDDPILDLRLLRYDCIASIAHAKMLGRIKILNEEEVRRLTEELEAIGRLADQGKFAIPMELEDCHTAIENRLTERLGDLGKKIHTARSRNDQVLAALRLFYKDELSKIRKAAQALSQELGSLSKRSGSVRLPGYTHTRKAMVSSVALWANGFREWFEDDIRLLEFTGRIVDRSPLGTGAGYGVPLEVDRPFVAKEAGFSGVQENPVYVQLSRGKFEATILHALGQLMLGLNRMSSDLIFFSMPEIGYFSLPEAFCTGSSIMPQKKNPDVLELIRARYHEVLAREAQLKAATSNLISGYHRDLQLTKKPVMEALDITAGCLSMGAKVIAALKVNAHACAKGLTEEVFATERVYELVKQGMPFREAYRTVAEKYEEPEP